MPLLGEGACSSRENRRRGEMAATMQANGKEANGAMPMPPDASEQELGSGPEDGDCLGCCQCTDCGGNMNSVACFWEMNRHCWPRLTRFVGHYSAVACVTALRRMAAKQDCDTRLIAGAHNSSPLRRSFDLTEDTDREFFSAGETPYDPDGAGAAPRGRSSSLSGKITLVQGIKALGKKIQQRGSKQGIPSTLADGSAKDQTDVKSADRNASELM